MADTQDLKVSKNDLTGVYVPKHTAKLIKAAIENGNAPFLPNNNNQLNPTFIFNANNGYSLEAKDLIPVILTKAEKGYESNAVGTYSTMGKAKTKTKENEKGVFYNFVGKDGEFHHATLFFAEQTEEPERFKEYASKNLRQKQNLSQVTLKIESPDVAEYMGTYVAACKSGAKVEVAPEVAEQFKTNLLAIADNELKHTLAEKDKNIPKVSDYLFSVEKKSNEIIKAKENELGIAPKQEQKQGQAKTQHKHYERKQEKQQSYSF